MSTTTSYPQVLRRILALLTAVVLVSWGTAALSPADAVEHGKTHKTAKTNNADKSQSADKTNNGNGADKSTSSSQSTSADKTDNGNGADKSSSSSQSTSPSSSESTGSSESQQGGTTTAAGQSGGDAEQSSAASKPSSTSGDTGDPAGNNGTVKLAGFGDGNGPGHSSGDGSAYMHPSNDPHLPCDFAVEAFGFDAVADTSGGTFDQHAPTRGGSSQDELGLARHRLTQRWWQHGRLRRRRDLQPRLRGRPAPHPRLPRQADCRDAVLAGQ